MRVPLSSSESPRCVLLLIRASSSSEPAPTPAPLQRMVTPSWQTPPHGKPPLRPHFPRDPQKSAPLVRLRQNVLGPFRTQADFLSATTHGVTLDMSGPLRLSFPTCIMGKLIRRPPSRSELSPSSQRRPGAISPSSAPDPEVGDPFACGLRGPGVWGSPWLLLPPKA